MYIDRVGIAAMRKVIDNSTVYVFYRQRSSNLSVSKQFN